MLLLAELSSAALQHRLAAGGVALATGPFVYRVTAREAGIVRGLSTLYADFPLAEDGAFHDFHVRVDRVSGVRRWLRPQVTFRVDGEQPFKPLAADHAFAMLEWGMNWCIAGQAHHFLLLHAATLERHGRCIVLPGEPGAGKSTLAAALMLAGWRLLSDELTIVDRDDGLLVPLARPISLKNASIAVIRAFAGEAVIGEAACDTHKGTVAHLRPTADSVRRMHQKAVPAHIVFPRWRAGAPMRLAPRAKSDAFMQVATHGFNYSLLGRLGFDLCASLVERCACWDFEYSRLDEAVTGLQTLVA